MDIKNYLSSYFIKVKKILGIKREYAYRDFSILLPADHRLPIYQHHHPKYDRFLPHLVKKIEGNSTIIDIGANCGDTLAGMVSENTASKYICIEPDQAFFDELVSNITRIKKCHPGLDVITVKHLVGNSLSNVSLEGVGGTRHAVVGKGTQTAKPLDEILADIACPPVKLLKIDVDGYDYDVIDSAQDLLVSQHPVLFFECQYDFDYQKMGFKKTIAWLNSIDYTNWTVFDNFGEIMLRTNDIQQLYQLIEYIWQQNTNSASRTIFYFDILANVNDDKKFVSDALSTY
jgi:FkbM family methyltransferase